MKVYGCPAEIPAPKIDFANYNFAQAQAEENRHSEDLKNWLWANGFTGRNTGKILRIPHADGYAQYMLAEGSKSCLIHLPYGDAWDSPNASFLPKKEVLARIQRQEKLAAL